MKVACTWCGVLVVRYPSSLQKHVFCCSACRTAFLSKEHNPEGYPKHEHLSVFNAENNNKRMTPEVRAKLREARLGTGKGESYSKLFGRHAHRIEAEKMLGRSLCLGEVVHHIDGNKRNYQPENLRVFESQAEHARWHKLNAKEVMPK